MTWKRREFEGLSLGGYVSDCGRFEVKRVDPRRCLRGRGPLDEGFNWTAWDLHESRSAAFKTARAAKSQAEEWGRRYSRIQMDEMRLRSVNGAPMV
jgi:hypothetical protein